MSSMMSNVITLTVHEVLTAVYETNNVVIYLRA